MANKKHIQMQNRRKSVSAQPQNICIKVANEFSELKREKRSED
jgi:hypothetical protein